MKTDPPDMTRDQVVALYHDWAVRRALIEGEQQQFLRDCGWEYICPSTDDVPFWTKDGSTMSKVRALWTELDR